MLLLFFSYTNSAKLRLPVLDYNNTPNFTKQQMLTLNEVSQFFNSDYINSGKKER